MKNFLKWAGPLAGAALMVWAVSSAAVKVSRAWHHLHDHVTVRFGSPTNSMNVVVEIVYSFDKTNFYTNNIPVKVVNTTGFSRQRMLPVVSSSEVTTNAVMVLQWVRQD